MSWLAGHLAATGISDLGAALRNQREDWGTDPHTHYFRVLEGREGVLLPPDRLAIYDERIQGYAARLNALRLTPIRLKYFQYLGALFGEIFLDRLFDDPVKLRTDLNQHVASHNAAAASADEEWPTFNEADLRKVAYWMATGSGKTLLMHMNLWQFLHHCPEAQRPENVLLITPNSGLSFQHLRELGASGINASWFGEAPSLTLFEDDPVTVIEITKLVETKRGGGLTVEVDAFGSNNLLLVDEAHRGASGDRWRELRRRLGADGFTFEYSATFGQIVNGAAPAARPALLEEYGKGVLFDYSYSHFYSDGYGKDYRVLNVRSDNSDFDDTVVLANAIGFLEQRLAHAEHAGGLQNYNIESPLWIFVGHTVTGKTKDDLATLSDVERLVLFLSKLASDREDAVDAIDGILGGTTGLRDADGLDIFASSFPYLRNKDLSVSEIYSELLRLVFNSSNPGTLRANVLGRGEGELALSVGNAPYFAVVNVGDLSALVTLLATHGVAPGSDSMTPSLFEHINQPASETNVLIGSRKFMEGWDSFRVSSLGIMNIGRGEGSQIVQLFGRGVRLWGRDFSLKRTQQTPSDVNPLALRTVETLGVYGVRADYMQQFREYLQQESISTDFEVVRVPAQLSDIELTDLRIPALPPGEDFSDTQVVKLAVDDEVAIALDLRPRVETQDSRHEAEGASERVAGENRVKDIRDIEGLLDWRRVVAEVELFRVGKELWNLTATTGSVWAVFMNGKIEVLTAAPLRPETIADLRRLEEVVASAVRKYAAASYELSRRRWERQEVTLVSLEPSHPNLDFGDYSVKVDLAKPDRLKEIVDLVAEGKKIYEGDVPEFPSLAWRQHLYQPLIVTDPTKAVLSAVPPELNGGEESFVRSLRAFVEAGGSKEWRVFLLRNLTRGRGVPFFDPVGGDAFYPDFILWLLQDEKQKICFVDPHGLRHSLGGFSDPKITLRLHLKDVEAQLQASGAEPTELASVIVSTSSYESVRRVFGDATKEDFVANNIVFGEDTDYIEQLFSIIQPEG